MKKTIVGLSILLLALVIVGCVDYKAYDVPKDEKDVAKDDVSLINEIAQIEQQIKKDDTAKTAVNSPETKPASTEIKVTTEKTTTETKKVGETPKTEVTPKLEEKVLPELKEEKPSTIITAEKTSTTEKIITESLVENNETIIKVKENDLLKLRVNVTDPDNDIVTFTYGKPLDKNGEWKTNYGDAGEYIIPLTATDGKLTTIEKVKILVQRVNVPPIVSNLPDIKVKEGELVKIDPKVTDPNGDAVTVKISAPLDTNKWQTDHTSAGEYLIKLVASDGELKTEKTFRLTVDNVNMPPTIEGIPKDLRVKEGEIVKIKPVVKDLDEDDVKVTISSPVGDKGIWQTRYTDHGDYTIIVTADDGKAQVKKEVHLVIEDVNVPPIIKDIVVQKN
jgi:hypothetical protein